MIITVTETVKIPPPISDLNSALNLIFNPEAHKTITIQHKEEVFIIKVQESKGKKKQERIKFNLS